MNIIIRKSFFAAVVTGLVLASSVAQATNGYFAHGYSTKEKGLAGAGAAYSQDAMAAATNPAGMAFVGERMDIGLALFSPSREYTATDPGGSLPLAPDGAPAMGFCALPDGCVVPFSINPGTVESENELFLIPHFGYNWKLDEKSAVGISVYGNGGMNSKYEGGSAATLNGATFTFDNNQPGTFGAGTAGVNLAQMFVNASYARKIDDDSAWGASIIFAYQKFSASGMENFGGFSNDPANLSGNRNSYSSGFGFKLGYQGELSPGFRFGASYQSEVSMGEFDEYRGLFAEEGDFDIPATATLGISYNLSSASMVVVDVQTIFYSDVPAIANPISNFRNPPGACFDPLNAGFFGAPPGGSGCLGGTDGAGFGWDDMTIIKIGYQWGEDTIWRVGISHGDNPIPSSETLFNILAPAVIDTHVTFGLTMPMGSDQEFNFAAMYAPSNSVSGPNPFDGGATQIEIEMLQYEFQAGWAWKY